MLSIIYDILQEQYAVPCNKLEPNLSINRELGIDGDDAYELIEFLVNKTGKKPSFDFSRYFYGEGILQISGRENLSVLELSLVFSEVN